MDDIWDEPAVVQASAPRTHEPLFTFSDDEDAGQQAPKPAQRKPAAKSKNADDLDDIVADLFDDIIDPNDIQTPVDIDAALARTRNAAKSASSDVNKTSNAKKDAETQPEGDQDGQTKPKRTIAKVDEQRLLSERGIPALIKEAKKFKPKGKGHEVEDLDRLMSIYQFWAHNMFPKTQFQDTIDRVERVCRSRRMLINMSMWRDAETTGRIHERDPNKSDSSEEEENVAVAATTAPVDRNAQTSAPPTSTRVAATSVSATMDDDVDLWDDVDDALAELQATNQHQPAAPLRKPAQASYPDDDELEEWFNADSEPVLPQKKQTEPQGDSMDIDDIAEAPTGTNPQRMLSPPRADNWDEDLFS